ncbi:heat shock protein 90 [Irineochytrium annulatum]|nr:heat shock protein 90 [Irineochytrium annulatum]
MQSQSFARHHHTAPTTSPRSSSISRSNTSPKRPPPSSSLSTPSSPAPANPAASASGANQETQEKFKEALVSVALGLNRAGAVHPMTTSGGGATGMMGVGVGVVASSTAAAPGVGAGSTSDEMVMKAASRFAASEVVMDRTAVTLAKCSKGVAELRKISREQVTLLESGVGKAIESLRDRSDRKKDVFVHELVANGNHALCTILCAAKTEPAKLGTFSNTFVCLNQVVENKTLEIWDSGVGMTKADLVALGTAPKSGTKAFKEALGAAVDFSKLHVGFYSAFLVADRVQVITKHNDDKQYIWESAGGDSFTITVDTANEALIRGTIVRLFLKELQTDYLEEMRIKEVVSKHCCCMPFPIQLMMANKTSKETRGLKRVGIPLEYEHQMRVIVPTEAEEELSQGSILHIIRPGPYHNSAVYR